MRIQNLELRNVLGSDTCQEIVKWHPNPYYQKQDQFRKDGKYYIDPSGPTKLDESCFLSPETCYAIVFIENGAIRFVEDRGEELETIHEMRALLRLAKFGLKVGTDSTAVMRITQEQMNFLVENSTHVYCLEHTWYHIPFWFQQVDESTVISFSYDHLPNTLIEQIKTIRNAEGNTHF